MRQGLVIFLGAWFVCWGGLAAQAAEFSLPEGFDASVFADDLGYARHLAVRDDGTVYTILRSRGFGGGLVAMRDDDGDGIADRIENFGKFQGSGIAFYQGYLYFATSDAIYRYGFAGDELVPEGPPELVVSGLPDHGGHVAKPFTFDDAGNIYITFGSPSNACSRGNRGRNPCPQLENRGGIWRFDATTLGQTAEDGERYVTGVRNAMGLDWNFEAGALFFAIHGRDLLGQLWPWYYSLAMSAELPAEEFHRAKEGADYGWPYTYYDHLKGARMVAPEYGGDGNKKDETEKYQDPLLAFPGHWAPNDVLFYTGDSFPEHYFGGAFIAFHGSWNRAPFPQEGFKVVFVPFKDGTPTGQWEIFADDFTGKGGFWGNHQYRPMGLAVGPAGELYISDSSEGRVWKITLEGQ